ncbi:uncharacterized protein LOC118193371 [Stegodyphus dumicola]|uniref:uncharacterized protein LOC118193371 n=1 Tax=Stegodyphus dumicola TaxID=202533 RepID=UPI0015AB330C|nr:uncharacterized protein LOC118193371 [Stegodyphus dumicola]
MSKNATDVKVALFLNAAGEEAVEVFNTLNLSTGDQGNYEKVLERFEAFTTPRTNVVVERFLFNKRKQEEGELFDCFVTDLKKLVKSCEFGEQSDSVIRDRIVLGVSDASLQERMLRENNLSLEKAIELGKAAELSKARAQTLREHNVDSVTRGKVKQHLAGGANAALAVRKHRGWRDDTSNTETSLCKKCNRHHVNGQCPAYGKKCFNCGKLNHFSTMCRLKHVQNVSQHGNADVYRESDDEFFVNSINVQRTKSVCSTSSTKEWTKTIIVEGTTVTFKLDTGSECFACENLRNTEC